MGVRPARLGRFRYASDDGKSRLSEVLARQLWPIFLGLLTSFIYDILKGLAHSPIFEKLAEKLL
jgi:hypothetical protein